MTTVKLHAHVGADGLLKLEVPVGLTELDMEVVLIFHPLKVVVASVKPTPEDLGWPPGFFEATFGAWAGEPLVREPQGEYEVRESLE